MTLISEVAGAGILSLITLLVIGILLVIYYSLGIFVLLGFLFLLYLFLIRSVSFQINFTKFD
jgi:hypothetical protein